MKAVNFALVALAGLGLASSQVAFADTLPAAAVPATTTAAPAAKLLHPVKMARFVEKRRSSDSDVVAAVPVIIGLAAVGSLGVGIYEVSKKGSPGT